MINILVTSVGGDIGMNIVNILLKQDLFKCSLFVVDIKKYVFSKNLVKNFYVVPKTNSDNYINKIDEIITLNNIELIIPSSEVDILFFNSNKKYFAKRRVKLLINDNVILENFLDKEKTSLILEKLGINTPKTYILDTYKDELNFPVIVKAKKSTISKMIRILNSKKELENLKNELSNKKDYIVQEYVGSVKEEYTTTVFSNSNENKSISFKRDLDGDKTGFALIDNYQELDDYSTKIAEYFNLNGSLNLQSRKNENKFYVFEINPRISSTVYIRNHFNFHDLLWWICTICDIKFTFTKADESGVAVIGYTYSFFKKEENENRSN